MQDGKFVFFDSEVVKRATNKAQRQALSKFGGYCRKVAKNSIKRSKYPSKPGSPPHSHTGRLKNNIFYGWDEIKRTVVIGPLKTSRSVPPVPNVLEYGGVAGNKIKKPEFKIGGTGPIRKRPNSGFRQGLVYAHLTTPAMVMRANQMFDAVYGIGKPSVYKPRPYMIPAFDKSLPKADDMFRNTLSKRR